MYTSVRKRSGQTVKFDIQKISASLAKAGQATGEFEDKTAQKLADRVIERLQLDSKAKIPTVEQIQDIVEDVLLASSHKKPPKPIFCIATSTVNCVRLLGRPTLT